MKEIIITSSVLILCIMLIRRAFRGKISSRLQYALWLLVALRLIVPSSAQIRMEIGSLEGFRVMDIAETLEDKTGDAAARFLLRVIGVQEQSISANGPSSVFIAGTVPMVWLGIVKGVWKGGMVVMAVWMVAANAVFAHRLCKNRKELELTEIMEGTKDTDGGKEAALRSYFGRVKIYTVKGLASPCLYGMPFREAVYLTPEVAEDTDKVRHVLTHEMCHKKHCDGFWSAVRNILLIVYWMDPLVWAAAILSKRDCELACDEAALAILGDSQRTAYGETLLSIITGKRKLSDIACTATTMTESGKSVKERIQYIVKKPRVLGAAVVAALLLVAAVSVLVFTRNPRFTGYTWEGEIMLTTENGLQVTLPETIAGISGYDLSEDGDIVLYQLASGREVGRFRKTEDAGVFETTVYSYGTDEGVAGTDSNASDTTYIIQDAGDGAVYQPSETPESVDYLPDETVTTTGIPRNYRYIQGDYTGLHEKYLDEMNYINSELKAATLW